jgi:hypothetical protein
MQTYVHEPGLKSQPMYSELMEALAGVQEPKIEKCKHLFERFGFRALAFVGNLA